MNRIKKRTESDLLGEIEVPIDVYYGAQTMRAILNFPVRTQKTIGDYPTLIEGLIACKKAAAIVNGRNGFITKAQQDAIVRAGNLVCDKKMYNQFPIHFLYGGGGTSGNMNVNEVLANIAEEFLAGKKGEYKLIHPNNHINLNQSTNDVYPTACHIAIIKKWPELRNVIDHLVTSFEKRSEELRDQKRVARTCLQEAVEITFKDLLDGYSNFLKRASERIKEAVNKLYAINLGGTIVGRKEDVPEIYFREIISTLREVMRDQNYLSSKNLFDATQNPDDMVNVSSSLALMAQGLVKIGKDFRLMNSGPEAGLNEIIVPPVQPGSSIMPGKINPVIPEFLIQCCFMIIGKNSTCDTALGHGELDLNIWETIILVNILDSMELLINGISTFDEKCIQGFKVNKEINERNANTIIPLLTRLMHDYGYTKINEICKKALGDNEKLRELLKKENLI